MVRLRSGKLVESVRGRGGGYKLARSPESINLWDVFGAVEDSIYPVECIGDTHACNFEAACVAKSAWEEIFAAVRTPLQQMTLVDIAAKWATEHRMCPIGGIRECRAGGSALNSIIADGESQLHESRLSHTSPLEDGLTSSIAAKGDELS